MPPYLVPAFLVAFYETKVFGVNEKRGARRIFGRNQLFSRGRVPWERLILPVPPRDPEINEVMGAEAPNQGGHRGWVAFRAIIRSL